MTLHRRLLLAIALAFSMSCALAAPKAREVEEQMRSKNWTQAERMLKEVLEEKPNSAKAWYLLAQTQEQQRNLGSALESLNRARQLDSSLKFSSPGAVDKMQRRLERATGRSSAAAERPAPSHEQRPAPRSEIAPSAPIAPSPILAGSPSSAQASEQRSGSGFGGFLLGFLALAGLGGAAYFFHRKAALRKQSEQRDTDRRALLARALAVQTRAAELLKTARFEAPDTPFMSQASAISSAADSALGRLKASASSSFSARDEERKLIDLEARVESAESKAARKSWGEEAPAPAPAPAPTFNEAFGGPSRRSRSDEFDDDERRPSRSHRQAPHTVVVQQPDPLGGLMGAVILNDLLRDHGSSSRERDLERQLERERSRNDDRAYEPPAPSYSEPAYEAPELDFGGSSSGSDDGWGSSSSPDVDTSNKDEF